MTGPEHYAIAEQLLELGQEAEDWEVPVAFAQAHATLALAAATALSSMSEGITLPARDREAWYAAAGTKRRPGEDDE